MPSGSKNADSVKPRLGLWDTVSIIVGIVVGVSIFKAPPLIFANVANPWQGLLAWVLGGILVLVGAFCYAELASTYPQSGGDYVYLSRAYGPAVGFFFAWAQIVAVLTGSIGVMAYVFADYAVEFFFGKCREHGWFCGCRGGGVDATELLWNCRRKYYTKHTHRGQNTWPVWRCRFRIVLGRSA